MFVPNIIFHSFTHVHVMHEMFGKCVHVALILRAILVSEMLTISKPVYI